MRPITKILLLLVAAFIVYLVWPRTPDLRAFDPKALAQLEVKSWEAGKDGSSALIPRFQIYASQLRFSPIAAFKIAQIDGEALASLKRGRGENAAPGEETRVVAALTEKYSIIKRDARGTFEPGDLARDEMAWISFVLDGAPLEEVITPAANLLAAIYGGDPAQFTQAATNLAAAQLAVFGTPSEDVISAGGPEAVAREGYDLLKEIANAPVGEAPAAEEPAATPES